MKCCLAPGPRAECPPAPARGAAVVVVAPIAAAPGAVLADGQRKLELLAISQAKPSRSAAIVLCWCAEKVVRAE